MKLNKKILIILSFLFFFFLFNINECFALDGYVNLNSYVLGFYPTEENSISINIEGLKYEGSPIANIISYYDTIYIKSDLQKYMLEEYNINLSNYTYYGFRYDSGGYGYAVTIWLSDSEYVSKAGVGMCPSSGNPFITLRFFIANNHSNDGQFSLALYSSYTSSDTRPMYSNMTSIGSYKVGDLVTDFPFTNSSFPSPSIPASDIFKIHLKDLNCGVWRNFSIQFPKYKDEKYLIYLDTFRRNYNDCTNEVEAVFKLIVFNNESFIGVNDLSNSGYYRSTNEIQKYVCRFCDNDSNNLFLYDREDGSIFVPFNALSYNIFESTLSFCSTSSNYSISEFKYVKGVSQSYFSDDYESIYGDKICNKTYFVGSNCNIISVYEKEDVSVLETFVSRYVLNKIIHTIGYGANYKYSIAYDFNEIYNRNSSCYGSNYLFQNEFWCDYRDNHKHIVEIDNSGNKVVIPETTYVDSGFVLSGSDSYTKDSNSNNVFDQNDDVLDFVPIVQTPTNTDTYLAENEEGEKIENVEDISETDKDIIESTKNDTSSWGVLDFLKGLFSSLSNLLEFMKKALFSILKGILNIGEKILSLFIPDGDFWSDFSTDVSSFLDEHLGLIFQPFDILGGVLNRYNNIEFVEPKLVIPEIKVPLTEYVLLESREVDFSQVFEIEIMSYLHNIYLCCVDVYLLFLVLNRIRKIEEEVFNK